MGDTFKAILRFAGYTAGVAMVGIFLLLSSVALLPENREPTGTSLAVMFLSVILICGSPALVGFWFWLKAKKTNRALTEQKLFQRRFFERERLIDGVDRHRAALRRNLDRSVRRNGYGAIIEDRREEALVEFLASIDLDVSFIDLPQAIEIISEQLKSYEEIDRQVGFDLRNLPLNGHEFEHWVANGLCAFGWEAEVTMASGDQGIDVIAMRGDQKLGIQCKLYSTPIGNKAIQEAHAGKTYHGVDKVAVLSNAGFTGSAKSLAAATGVLLFSHHDIPKLYEQAFVA